MMLMIYTAPSAHAGGNGMVCKGNTYQLFNASAIAYNTLHWATKGDGNFDNPAVLNTIYTPGPQDIVHGNVKLMLYATGSVACPVASDSLVLTILPLPQVDLGKDTLTCANAVVVLNATNPDASAYFWYPSMKTTPTISVDSAGIGLHSKKITVFVTDQAGCIARDSVMVSFKICGGIEELSGVSLQVFPNPNNGIFTLELKTIRPENLSISIITSSGETVYTRNNLAVSGMATEKIDISRLIQGTYILQLSNGSGTLMRKIVIQK
jgi:hypothetical protein